ncbi:MAG TPA: hypothetical protein VKA95_08335 [Nitrososphaeraceae archaeon]|nr:hypothetical protein [Nitrososphaeraceae archaeon]
MAAMAVAITIAAIIVITYTLGIYVAMKKPIGWGDKFGQGNYRIIQSGGTDPEDHALYVTGQGAKVEIVPYKEIAVVSGKSPRLWVTKEIEGEAPAVVQDKWLNTEMKVSFYNSKGVGTISLRSLSNHLQNCGFGGYIVTFYPAENKVYAKKEGLHPIYTRRITTENFEFPENKWISIRQISKKSIETKYVSLEASVSLDNGKSWKKVLEAMDRGKWNKWDIDPEDEDILKRCGKELKDLEKPFLEPAESVYLRMDNSTKVLIKDYYVNEIP